MAQPDDDAIAEAAAPPARVPMSLEPFLAFAQHLADKADRIALRYWRQDFRVSTKPDRTPVTQADTEIEEMVRRELARAYPEHGILGEEFGALASDAPWRWIVDPIDATAAFLRGVPNFATLLGLEDQGRLVLGLISAPAMGLRWWGGPDLGAFENGRPIQVSAVATLADAHVCHGELKGFPNHGYGKPWDLLWPQTWRQSGLGDFYGHMVVANGGADFMIEPVVNPWDMAAVKPIVEGAGGRVTDLAGADTVYSGTGLTTNGLLHDAVLRAFARPG